MTVWGIWRRWESCGCCQRERGSLSHPRLRSGCRVRASRRVRSSPKQLHDYEISPRFPSEMQDVWTSAWMREEVAKELAQGWFK